MSVTRSEKLLTPKEGGSIRPPLSVVKWFIRTFDTAGEVRKCAELNKPATRERGGEEKGPYSSHTCKARPTYRRKGASRSVRRRLAAHYSTRGDGAGELSSLQLLLQARAAGALHLPMTFLLRGTAS